MSSSSIPRTPSRRFLPPDPRVAEPYRLTPQLALRLAVLGVLAVALFAILFLRLWALEVLSSTHYLQAAQDNQLRTLRLDAPRGPILDRNGKVLVTNVAGTAVEIWPADLPKTGAYAEVLRLANVLGLPAQNILAGIASHKGDPLTPVTVEQGAHQDQVDFLLEHQGQFPGVQIAQNFLRRYRYQALGAQILGYVSEISPAQLHEKAGYKPGDTIGQAGIEERYDRYLRGRAGAAQLRVDSRGRPQSDLVTSAEPRAGNAIRLTLDIELQRATERALRYGIQLARNSNNYAANGGAIVALDPRDGSVLALASYPTYKPSLYVGRVDPKKLAEAGLTTATATEKNFPGLDRAIAGQYPPGSSWKPVTALAAMQEHVLAPYSYLPCTPDFKVAGQTFNNWTPNVNTGMDLPTALAASCDTYFYRVGYDFYNLPADRGHALQLWAGRFGFNEKTGIDIGPESPGLLPTPEWRKQTYTKKTDPGNYLIDREWKPGDSIQLAIGQKDLLVTPLQMARFYALIANGGKLVTPHIAEDVEIPGANGAQSRRLRSFGAQPPAPTNVDPGALAVVRQGLFEATHSSIGTSVGVFGSFPVPISGKTGTAEKVVQLPGYPAGHIENQSWWCGYGPSDNAQIVVCALIENGGHGGTAAAPAALKVFEAYFGKHAQTTYHPSD